MDFYKTARETVFYAQVDAEESHTPDEPKPNSIVVTFSGSTWTITDNGETVQTENFDEAVRIVQENLEQATN